MKNAKTKPGSKGEIKKDKSIERSSKIPRWEATDLSDAQDSVIFGRYWQQFRWGNASLPGLHAS